MAGTALLICSCEKNGVVVNVLILIEKFTKLCLPFSFEIRGSYF